MDRNCLTIEYWDTAGQENFRSMTSTFFKKSNICFFVFDISDEETFTGINKWMQEIERANLSGLVKVLVPAKCDLDSDREVDEDAIKEYANSHDCLYFGETSAKEDINVTDLFEAAAMAYVDSLV
eukprot:TRINITY_DN2060_c0_g1_i3.p1 TRINITY_DN2060_c0_g1~~TRINITY_DN2060_c0_g1_i3.p1  ORF type:complete len:125 (+),score=28.77 TRINITY_DN2060_c0_g1_i3:457-831(+)